MDEQSAIQRFGEASVARLATVGPDGPHLVPVVFAVEGRRIVTAVDRKPKTTTALQRLANIETDPRVSLLVDHYDDDWSRLWWVRVDGEATVVAAGPAFDDAIALLARKYQQYRAAPPPGPAVVIEIDHVVGWTAAGQE